MINNKIQFTMESLNVYFTEDAWYVVQAYFSKLQKKMDDSGVPKKRQAFILSGLSDFINEYVEEYKDKEKINFDLALLLLREIGSPTDIVLTLDSPKDRETIAESGQLLESGKQRICQACHYSNDLEALFCENCGQRLVSEVGLAGKVKQELIDHTYLASFLAIYSVLFVLGISWEILFHPSFGRSIQWDLPISIDLVIINVTMFGLAIFLMVIAGTILDYRLKDKKSSKIKYKNALDNFERRFFLGAFLAFFSGLLFGYLALTGLWWSAALSFTAIGCSMGWLQHHVLWREKPKEIPYFDLLTAKKMLDGYFRGRLAKLNINVVTVMTISILIGAIGSSIQEGSTFAGIEATLDGLIFFLCLIGTFSLAVSGFALMHYYDWPSVTKIIAEGTPKTRGYPKTYDRTVGY
ncbi:MAG: hypothetical protein ACXADX_17590 [Candidatus Hodarchaeales archaeon]|jgi:hypothetical protein